MTSPSNLVISKDFTFEASHVLPKHPGKCSRLHGHSWKLTVAVRGPVDPETGFVMDYAELSEIVKREVIDVLDHQHLGHGSLDDRTWGHFYPALLYDFYPTSENLIGWIVRTLQSSELALELHSVTLHETCTSACTWRNPNA